MSRKPILFYDKDKPHYEFTNFYPASVNISEIPKNLGLSPDLVKSGWKTGEHLFQAAKFTDPEIIGKIYEAQTPREVYDLANGRNGEYKKTNKTRLKKCKYSGDALNSERKIYAKWEFKEKIVRDWWCRDNWG